MKKKSIIISPHFDDGIGSCGGLISRLKNENNDISVLTVFAAPPLKAGFSPFAKKLHRDWSFDDNDVIKGRELENERACQSIGCKIINLSYPDAIYRLDKNGDYLYANPDNLFSEYNNSESFLFDSIFNELKVYSDCRLYFPVGVGNHIDHNIIHKIGLSLCDAGFDIIFYKDFFYKLSFEKSDYLKKFFIEENFEFSLQNFNAKILAFSSYESQIPNLFHNTKKMYGWFLDNNYSYRDYIFFETFYRKK